MHVWCGLGGAGCARFGVIPSITHTLNIRIAVKMTKGVLYCDYVDI